MTRKIYFLGGKLNAWEKEKLFEKYKRKLSRAVGEYSSAGFRFVPVEDVTVKKFKKIWTDKDTYGIFWFGHGTPGGLPATNEPYGNFYRTLNPMTLPKANRNLQFLALLSCFSKGYEKEWRKKMSNIFAQIATFKYTIEGFTGQMNDQIDRWIEKKRFLTNPSSGAHGLLRFAHKRASSADFFNTKTPLVISSDYFEPDHRYVRTITIPKVARPRRPRRVVPPRTGKPVVPKPQKTVPTHNWNINKHKGKWQIGPTPAPSGIKTGGIQTRHHGITGAGTSLRTKRTGREAEAYRKRIAKITAAKMGRGQTGGGIRPYLGPKPKGGHLPSPHGTADFGDIRVTYSPRKHVIIKTPGF